MSAVRASCSSFSFSLSPLIIETSNLNSYSLHPHTLGCTPALTGYVEKHLSNICSNSLCRTLGKLSDTWLTAVASCSPPFCTFYLHHYCVMWTVNEKFTTFERVTNFMIY